MAKLSITFHGVCAHFMGVVPGVPHRVVLPDASAFQFGIVDVGVESAPDTRFDYFLMPHLAILRTGAEMADEVHMPGSVEHGNVFNGIRLQVRNGTDSDLTYGDMSILPRLAYYVPDYVYSPDVVLGGRAVCYFDIFTGHVSAVKVGLGAVNVVATFETAGAPELLITPFFPSQTPDPLPKVLPLDDADPSFLTVANVGYACSDGQQNFDFLLQYLTAQGGIPRIVSRELPGMKGATSMTSAELQEAAKQLTEFDFPRRLKPLADKALQRKQRVQPLMEDVSATCSNSGYP